MKTNNSVQGCTAEITVKKNSLKKYNGNHYLKSGQEFEILLRNTTKDTVMATIKINGKDVSNTGLVLKPGQKVYLERYLDQNKKFLFETYLVDRTEEVMKAIEDNGNIEVSFFKEKITLPVVNTSFTISVTPDWYNYTNTGTAIGFNALSKTSSNSFYNSAVFNQSVNSLKSRKPSAEVVYDASLDEIETGRVGKGSASNQSFYNYTGEFERYPFRVISLKLLPQSLKPLEVKDLATYCTNCGTKNRKSNYKFCPKCGNKY